MFDLPARSIPPTSMGQVQAPATDRQIGYCLRLLDERGLMGTRGNDGLEITDERVRQLSKAIISKWITKLLAMPPSTNRRVWMENVPDGRYALYLGEHSEDSADARWYFFVIHTNERGFRKVYNQASSELHFINNREYAEHIMKLISEDPQGASKAYGVQLGACGVCGRTLTHPDSIAAGIGPVCASRMGW